MRTHLLELHAVVLEDDRELGVQVRLERLALEDGLCFVFCILCFVFVWELSIDTYIK
jgi:hypothetical protein